MAANAAPITPGIPQLCLPHLLFDPNTTLGTPRPHDFGLQTGRQPLLPFQPLGDKDMPRITKLAPLIRSMNSTKAESRTRVAQAVLGLPPHFRLCTLKKCDNLLERLRYYADPRGPGIIATSVKQRDFVAALLGPNGQMNQQAQLSLHTGGTPGHSWPWPDARHQYDAMAGLAGWFQEHQQRSSSVQFVESEPAIQDQVTIQLLRPLSLLLQVSDYPSILLSLQLKDHLTICTVSADTI